RALTVVPLRDDALAGRLGADEVVSRLCQAYVKERCDGLFLDAVSSLGVRLPAAAVVEAIRNAAVRFVVLDGAQEFCHAASDLSRGCCDLSLAGAHKWLEAYQPLGLAFFGRARSAALVRTALEELLAVGELDDP